MIYKLRRGTDNYVSALKQVVEQMAKEDPSLGQFKGTALDSSWTVTVTFRAPKRKMRAGVVNVSAELLQKDMRASTHLGVSSKKRKAKI